MAQNIYANTVVPANEKQPLATVSRAYRGISTVADNKTFALYDIALIKQDIINHFHIRQGEKLENPEFGCIICVLTYLPYNISEALTFRFDENNNILA